MCKNLIKYPYWKRSIHRTLFIVAFPVMFKDKQSRQSGKIVNNVLPTMKSPWYHHFSIMVSTPLYYMPVISSVHGILFTHPKFPSILLLPSSATRILKNISLFDTNPYLPNFLYSMVNLIWEKDVPYEWNSTSDIWEGNKLG